MAATSVLVWREPYRVFSRLADGAVNPAWNFAAYWCAATRIAHSLVDHDPPGKIAARAIVAALSAGLHLLVIGTLFHLVARALGSSTSWSLAARAQGYSSAWLGPAALLQLLAALYATNVEIWWICAGAGALLVNGGMAYAFFALARGRGGLALGRAALAGILVALPQCWLDLHRILHGQ